MKQHLLPLATVVTPNIFEATQLAGMDSITSLADAKAAAKIIHSLEAKNVVIKCRDGFGQPLDTPVSENISGAIESIEQSMDLIFDGEDFVEVWGPHINTIWNHGAGCTFSACVTAELAKGNTLINAVKTAKMLMTEALRESFPLNAYAGPVNHKAFALK